MVRSSNLVLLLAMSFLTCRLLFDDISDWKLDIFFGRIGVERRLNVDWRLRLSLFSIGSIKVDLHSNFSHFIDLRRLRQLLFKLLELLVLLVRILLVLELLVLLELRLVLEPRRAKLLMIMTRLLTKRLRVPVLLLERVLLKRLNLVLELLILSHKSKLRIVHVLLKLTHLLCGLSKFYCCHFVSSRTCLFNSIHCLILPFCCYLLILQLLGNLILLTVDQSKRMLRDTGLKLRLLARNLFSLFGFILCESLLSSVVF